MLYFLAGCYTSWACGFNSVGVCINLLGFQCVRKSSCSPFLGFLLMRTASPGGLHWLSIYWSSDCAWGGWAADCILILSSQRGLDQWETKNNIFSIRLKKLLWKGLGLNNIRRDGKWNNFFPTISITWEKKQNTKPEGIILRYILKVHSCRLTV